MLRALYAAISLRFGKFLISDPGVSLFGILPQSEPDLIPSVPLAKHSARKSSGLWEYGTAEVWFCDAAILQARDNLGLFS